MCSRISFLLVFLLYFIFKTSAFQSARRQNVIVGFYPSTLTPFDDEGNLNISAIEPYAKYLKLNGATGVLITSLFGEGPNLSVEEHKQLIKIWMTVGIEINLKVIVQIGGIPLTDMIVLAKYCDLIQVNAILLLPNLYYKPETVDQLLTLTSTVAEAAPTIPIIYYHIPKMMTGVNLDIVEYYNRAAESIPQFKGIKSELQEVLHIESHSLNQDPDLTFYVDDHELLSAAVYLRFDLFAASATNIFPRLVKEVMDCVQNGDMARAKFEQKRLNALITSITLEGNLIAVYKAAMEMLTGIKFGTVKPPLEPLSEQARKNVEGILNANRDIKYAEYHTNIDNGFSSYIY